MSDATPFQKEAWTEYSLGVIILLLRIFARAKAVGVRKWEGDDYFAILALVFWTVSRLRPTIAAVRHTYGMGLVAALHARADRYVSFQPLPHGLNLPNGVLPQVSMGRTLGYQTLNERLSQMQSKQNWCLAPSVSLSDGAATRP